MYSPVMKFPNDESSLKRNFDKYLEKQGSRLDQYATQKKRESDKEFTDEFNIARLKLATAATVNRTNPANNLL